jgi:hypothetical protein
MCESPEGLLQLLVAPMPPGERAVVHSFVLVCDCNCDIKLGPFPVWLVQVVRRQPELVVNALGSAVAENRGLGRLCRDWRKLCWGRSCSSPMA